MVKKIEVKLIHDELSRQLSFAKRRNGLIKKALELHRVCGLDCLFVSFSPSGRLSYFSGDKRIEDVLARFAAVPENLRKFHLSELELQQLVSILRELKEQTEEHIENDRTIFEVQQATLEVKEEILRAKGELRRYQPLSKAIMTITEADTSEGFLEEALAKVQERKKELTGHIDNNDASQPAGSKVAVENPPANPSDEVHQSELEHQPNEDLDKNQDQTMPNQSPTSEGYNRLQITPMMESNPPVSLVFEMASPHPYQAGTTFTSLLLGEDVADETLSPIKETETMMHQHNSNGFFQHNQFSVFQDGVLNTQFYSNNSNITEAADHNQSSEQNETPNSNNINFPVSNLAPSDFQIPGAFQMPQQMLMGGTAAALTTRSPLFSSRQWNNQNPTSLGEKGGFQEMLNSVAGLNVFPDATTPAFPSPPNLLMNLQPMGGQTMDLSAPLDTQGSLANSASQGNQICSTPRHFGSGESSSSAQKRKLRWEDDIFLGLSNSENGNTASNGTPPAPRPPRNLAYNTAYEIMGLPIDPHFRMLHELKKNAKGKQQQE